LQPHGWPGARPNPDMAEKRFILTKVSNGTEIALTGQLTVGRSTENGLKLAEGSPSRRHATLNIADGAVFVEDLNSTNGTYVNDKRIETNTRVKLKSNDRLRFDVEQFLLRIESDDPPTDQTIQRMNEADLVIDAGNKRLPQGWIENPKKAGNETRYISPEQVRQERKRLADLGAVDRALGGVEAPQLVVLGGPEGTVRIELRSAQSGQKEWTVGSQGEREILLKRDGVSALHAKIVNEGNRWKVIDQLSANGTFVNGRRCTMSYLASTDRITFGPVECIFQLPKGSGAARSGPATGMWKKILLGAGIVLFILVIAYAAWFLLRR
jgi:pSer/pThr/pTyr-binding forkhead associated (FHA) protein